LVQEELVDFLIKWNPRREDPIYWLEYVKKQVYKEGRKLEWSTPRDGIRVALFSQRIEEKYTHGPIKGESYIVRWVIRITERTIDKNGQFLLSPNITLEGCRTYALTDALGYGC